MKRESFSTSGPADFPGTLVQLTRPKQMFVEHVVFGNHAPVHKRMFSSNVDVGALGDTMYYANLNAASLLVEKHV